MYEVPGLDLSPVRLCLQSCWHIYTFKKALQSRSFVWHCPTLSSKYTKPCLICLQVKATGLDVKNPAPGIPLLHALASCKFRRGHQPHNSSPALAGSQLLLLNTILPAIARYLTTTVVSTTLSFLQKAAAVPWTQLLSYLAWRARPIYTASTVLALCFLPAQFQVGAS